MPFPVQPNPRTWSAGDIITVPRLRADLSNLAWLLTMRPTLVGALNVALLTIPSATITPVVLDSNYLDNWGGHIAGTNPQATYKAPLTGWYLCDGNASFNTAAGSGYWAAGIQADQNGTTSDSFGQILINDGVNPAGPGASDLVELNSGTSDTVALFAYQNTGASVGSGSQNYFTAEWVGLPTDTFSGSVTGTVVTSPDAAALWPPGTGTTLTAPCAAGATTISVASATGLVTGAALGLDYYEGQAVSPMAETVTITGIIGLSIGITATVYPHGGTNSPGTVAVPVSAAWMNQQARDVINFLAYPPMARLANSTQTLAAQVFPASTTISFGSATVDNFLGWNGTTTYTIPVSGLYYVYGCVPFTAGSANNYFVGISINGGTTIWGDGLRTQSSGQPYAATFRKHIRVTAGQTVTLQACLANGGATVSNTSNQYAIFILLWRAF